jgi:hypothetical protein
MRVAIITWLEVQFPLCITNDLFALKMRDPGGGPFHLWKLVDCVDNIFWVTAASGRLKPQLLF